MTLSVPGRSILRVMDVGMKKKKRICKWKTELESYSLIDRIRT